MINKFNNIYYLIIFIVFVFLFMTIKIFFVFCLQEKNCSYYDLIKDDFLSPSSLSELTSMTFNTELTHLGSKAPIYNPVIQYFKFE